MKLDVKLGRDSYPILIARGMLAEAGQHLALARRVLVVTDDGVPTQYARRVLDACEAAHGVGVLVTLRQGNKHTVSVCLLPCRRARRVRHLPILRCSAA